MNGAILVGIDDTDTLDDPGTNQLARHLVRRFGRPDRPSMVTRHQLLEDPRVPCTRKNGCVAARFETAFESLAATIEALRSAVQAWCPVGSDPGLCVVPQEMEIPAAVIDHGRRCQRELVRQADARSLAAEHGMYLEGLGGTEDGVIGALAAVGLHTTGDDGRVVHCGLAGEEPFEITGPLTVSAIHARGVVEVRRHDDGSPVSAGTVAIEKKLRPNFRGGRVVLFVAPCERSDVAAEWQAVRLV